MIRLIIITINLNQYHFRIPQVTYNFFYNPRKQTTDAKGLSLNFVCNIKGALSRLTQLLVMQEEWFDKKDKVYFKIYRVTTWLKINYNKHISQISRSKQNQTMNFGQLLEYNMRNNAQNVVQKLIPDPFLKNQDRAYHCINCQGFIYRVFYCMPKSSAIEIY